MLALLRRHVHAIYNERCDPVLLLQFCGGMPEWIDARVHAPEFIAEVSLYLQQVLNAPRQEKLLRGLRSGHPRITL